MDNCDNFKKLLARLCTAGKEAKCFIEECAGRDYKNQYIAVAVVSIDEILNEDVSVIDDFLQALHGASLNGRHTQTLAFTHGRLSVVLNRAERNGTTGIFYQHGECRLFDPTKRISYRIIDDIAQTAHPMPPFQVHRTHLHDTLDDMIREYHRDFQVDDMVILLYSHYIPCDVPFHECARVLREYATDTGYSIAVAYRNDSHYSDKSRVKQILSGDGIILVEPNEIINELNKQIEPYFLAFETTQTVSDIVRTYEHGYETEYFRKEILKYKCNRRKLKRYRHNDEKRKNIKQTFLLTEY